jgi:parallel beta-helix repeat protein
LPGGTAPGCIRSSARPAIISPAGGGDPTGSLRWRTSIARAKYASWPAPGTSRARLPVLAQGQVSGHPTSSRSATARACPPGAASAGLLIGDAGTAPLVRANRAYSGHWHGTLIYDNASPRIEGNKIRAQGGSPISIGGAGTDPFIRANQIRDGRGNGIWIHDGASPTIAGNTITGNAREAIRVGEDADPKITRNVVSGWLTIARGLPSESVSIPRLDRPRATGSGRIWASRDRAAACCP